jgi:hypothetical protein
MQILTEINKWFPVRVKKTAEKNYRTLFLNTQKALLGEVVSSLRGVAIDWEGDTILMYFYNDGEISDELENDYRCIGTEVVADYYDAYIDDKVIRLDFPTPLPQHEYWAYRRKEIY